MWRFPLLAAVLLGSVVLLEQVSHDETVVKLGATLVTIGVAVALFPVYFGWRAAEDGEAHGPVRRG